MRKAVLVIFGVMLCACFAGTSFAESATKDECVAKSKEAAQLIVDKGQDAAFEQINDAGGNFKWKDTYVFVIALDGTLLARSVFQQNIGANIMQWQDQSDPPKQPIKEMVEIAKDKGEGWVTYWHPKPGEQGLSKKVSYVYRVPGKDFFVGAGIYE